MNREIYYNVTELTLRQRINVMKFAKEKSFEWWVDELDTSKDYFRKKVEMSFEDILKKFKITSHFLIVNRYDIYGEICFCTLKNPDYFLWINVSMENFEELIKKFNLKKR